MTTQEMHDGIVAWFSRPDAVLGRQMILASSTTCVYRGDENPESNVRCGIGCMIPNNLYDPEMENKTIEGVTKDEEFDALREHFRGVSRNYMIEVQGTHDSLKESETVQDFLDGLKLIASRYDLTHNK